MVTSFLRAIPGWIMYHISDFLTLLRSRTLSPPRREFIHLINPAPTKTKTARFIVPPRVMARPKNGVRDQLKDELTVT